MSEPSPERSRPDCSQQLRQLLAQKILVIDGAMGTMIQGYGLEEADYRGERFADWPSDLKGNNDLLSLTQPALIRTICDRYIAAGASVLATNTFNANRISQADYGAEALVREMNVAAARVIREACDDATAKDGIVRFVCGAMGPTNKTLSLSPDVEDPGFREVTF
ncbi:MAG: homocysteine S-methyltransferase family protein, partial [Panacagrimonas sp.]